MAKTKIYQEYGFEKKRFFLTADEIKKLLESVGGEGSFNLKSGKNAIIRIFKIKAGENAGKVEALMDADNWSSSSKEIFEDYNELYDWLEETDKEIYINEENLEEKYKKILDLE